MFHPPNAVGEVTRASRRLPHTRKFDLVVDELTAQTRPSRPDFPSPVSLRSPTSFNKIDKFNDPHGDSAHGATTSSEMPATAQHERDDFGNGTDRIGDFFLIEEVEAIVLSGDCDLLRFWFWVHGKINKP